MDLTVKYANNKELKEEIKEKTGVEAVYFDVIDNYVYDALIIPDGSHVMGGSYAIAIGDEDYSLCIALHSEKSNVKRIMLVEETISEGVLLPRIAAAYYEYKAKGEYKFFNIYTKWEENPREFFKANIYKEVKEILEEQNIDMELTNTILEVAYNNYIAIDVINEAEAVKIIKSLVKSFIPTQEFAEDLDYKFRKAFFDIYT